MENQYTCYHLHSDLSLLDSCTKFQDYINKAVELGQKSLCFTEHGNIFRWIAKRNACKKAGIKYLHGVEVYLTRQLEPKVRDNYHTILIAKNMDGLKEVNTLVSLSNHKDHFYFKPRITFDEFLNISDNVIKISACLASPLARLDNDIQELQNQITSKQTNLDYVVKKDDLQNKDESIKELADEIKQLETELQNLKRYYKSIPLKYDYYEIQPHINSQEQIDYNKDLFELAKKNNKPLIAGTDTHSIDKYKAECRSILQSAKGIEFANEDEFDLTYKSYDELVQMFVEQNSLPKRVYLEAIENTNVMADSCEEIELDEAFKYPKVYEDDIREIKLRINQKYKEKIDSGIIKQEDKEEFKSRLIEELQVLQKIEMCGFMLFMSDLISWCWENNIPVGPARGSVGGSCVAYVLGITDVNPLKWKTIFSRFANEHRKEIGDIDVDFAPNDREKVYNHMIQRFGENYTDYILAIGTVSDRGTIDEIGRALSKKNPDDARFSLESLKVLKDEYISYKEPKKKELDAQGIKSDEAEQQAIEYATSFVQEKYPEIFYYFKGILNTAISQSMHPAGMVISPITLYDNYGELYRDDKKILQIDMEDIHDVSLVKYDILGLKTIEIIKDACETAGIPYPKAHEIDWDDQDVWTDMFTSPYGVFQFEEQYAFSMLKKFEAKNIFDMSLITAAIRPSGGSYRDDLIAKKIHKNPSPMIDELLKDNYGYLVYQEDTIKFLQYVCGLSGGDADNVRRAIGRKQKDRLEEAMPSILEGYCKMSPQPREIAEEEAKQFLQIIADSASYQFNYNHSVAYCMIGYLCAYLRYYHTADFITSYLNNAQNDADKIQGSELAKLYKIDVFPPRFRYSIDKYFIDEKSGDIYKGVASIKFLNEGSSLYLYSLRENKYDTFIDLLIDLKNSGQINSKQIKILINLQYFTEFGGNKKLLTIYDRFETLYGRKTLSKENISTLGITPETALKWCDKETEKQYGGLNSIGLLKSIEEETPNENLPLCEQIAYEAEILGYISATYNVDKKLCYVLDVETKFSPKVKLYVLQSGKEVTVKIQKATYNKVPLLKGNIVCCQRFEEKFKSIKTENGFQQIDEKEWWLREYRIVSENEWEKAICD
jgi:DNA polymerase-3 subunit alpha